MYGGESWTVNKAEHWKIDAFELWCWRRLLKVPWTARRSNQSLLKEISPGCSLEGLMLKLKLQYFGHLMRRVDSLEKTLMLGGVGGRRRRGRQRMRWLDGITEKSWTRLSNWTELNWEMQLRHLIYTCMSLHFSENCSEYIVEEVIDLLCCLAIKIIGYVLSHNFNHVSYFLPKGKHTIEDRIKKVNQLTLT